MKKTLAVYSDGVTDDIQKKVDEFNKGGATISHRSISNFSPREKETFGKAIVDLSSTKGKEVAECLDSWSIEVIAVNGKFESKAKENNVGDANLDKMTLDQLLSYAKEEQMEIPDEVKLKADVLDFIKNELEAV